MNAKYDELLRLLESELRASLDYLEYSHKKIQHLPSDPSELDAETMETWEAYLSRFARVTDIFLNKYLRILVVKGESSFQGDFKDYIEKGLKKGFVLDPELWFETRELRQKVVTAHSRTELKNAFENVSAQTPFVIKGLRKIFP